MILAYDIPTNFTYEYLRIKESTVIESLKAFVKAIVKVFSDWYLKAPNKIGIAWLLSAREQHGFSGMLGSIDCRHCKWKVYVGHCHELTIILEARNSQDLRIWHAWITKWY